MKKNFFLALAIVAASIFAASCQDSPTMPSGDATLSALSLETGGAEVAISPSFASGTTSYTATVDPSVSSVTVAATATDPGAALSGAGTASLSAGANSLSVVVTAADGATKKTYTIEVTRGLPPEDVLSDLSIVDGDMSVALNAAFASGTASYTARLPNSCANLRVYAAPQDVNAVVTMSLGSDSIPVTVTTREDSTDPVFTGGAGLAVGLNRISVVVTAADGVTKRTYTVEATRVAPGLSDDARLDSIAITANGSPVTLAEEEGKAGGASYSGSVAASVTSVVVAAVARDPAALVYGNGTVSLAPGINRLRVVVTAADGTAERTRISITRGAVATLSDYVGSWAYTDTAEGASYSISIAADGSAEYTIAYSDHGGIYVGTLVVDPATGSATVTNTTVKNYSSYVYDAAAGTLDTLDDHVYARVGADTGSIAGNWSTPGGYYTLSFRTDGTFTYSNNTGATTSTATGIWDGSRITYIDGTAFSYTAHVGLGAPSSMIVQYGHEVTTLTKP